MALSHWMRNTPTVIKAAIASTHIFTTQKLLTVTVTVQTFSA